MSFSRRSFLSGRFRTGGTELRPPRALSPGAFEDACNRCGDCIKGCPATIIVPGDGGFPKMDFSKGACNFCGDCARACRRAVLGGDAAPVWRVTATVDAACLASNGVECRVCGEACDAGAIRFRLRAGGIARPEIDPARCTGCGACYAPCPANAITMNNGLENKG